MHQNTQSTTLPVKSPPPWALDAVQLWLEEEDKEESRRIGELKERQKQRQRAIEEEYKKRQEQASRQSDHSKL
jgi:hypothetical protein